jgi:hypothetical protein
MKAVIHYLSKHYGNNNYTKLVHWVNTQYSRSGALHGQNISLADVNDFAIVEVLKKHVETLSLPLETLLNGLSILPRINSSGSDFEPVLKLNHKAFMLHFEAAGLIVDDIVFPRRGDKVEYTGSDYHTKSKLYNKNSDNEVICGFINFSIDGYQGSLILSNEEIEGEKASGIANLFNGVNTLSDEEWLSSACALLFKRLLSEATSSALLKKLKPEEVSYIRELIDLSEIFYEDNGNHSKGSNNKYFNDFGRVIGQCYKRFGALDKKKHSQLERKDNVVPISLSKTKSGNNSATSKDEGSAPKSYAQRTSINGFGKF